MFFDLISRNSKRNRKENGLFFSSLVISIIAFYLILSLENQDVMRFLTYMESDAVNRLFTMIPLFYIMTLFILFFLVYFASKYQLGCRCHEFGMYQMLGMRRYTLFFLLLAEDISNGFVVLLIGLPIGIVISELISLITGKLVGIGIIGHTFSFSFKAVIFTVAGFLIIKLIAFLILSGKIAKQEIGDLLQPKPVVSKKQLAAPYHMAAFVGGIMLLSVAYVCAIRGLSWVRVENMALTLFSGLAGTFLLFFGMRSFIQRILVKSGKGDCLHVFTFRQLQEEVVRKSNTMAISSLLTLAALCCFGCGVSIALNYDDTEKHLIDYTFTTVNPETDLSDELKKYDLEYLFSDVFDMKVDHIKSADDNYDNTYSMDSVMMELKEYPDSDDKDVLINNLGYQNYPYLVSLSGYNKLLEIAGQNLLQIGDNEAVVYMDPDFTTESRTKIMDQIIEKHPRVFINGEAFYLTNTIQSINLVVDRAITLSFALIVTDTTFDRITQGGNILYQNAVLNANQTEGKSLLTAVMDTNNLLDNTGIAYESYLQNIGRKLFYAVAASYITIYLAIVFLIISNTVIGIQFLTRQQQTEGRYKSLIRIGTSYPALKNSARKQINWSFCMPVSIAAISSLFGIRALFSGLLSSYTGSDLADMTVISFAMIILLCVVEYIYMIIVKKTSDRYLLSLMTLEREE